MEQIEAEWLLSLKKKVINVQEEKERKEDTEERENVSYYSQIPVNV